MVSSLVFVSKHSSSVGLSSSFRTTQNIMTGMRMASRTPTTTIAIIAGLLRQHFPAYLPSFGAFVPLVSFDAGAPVARTLFYWNF